MKLVQTALLVLLSPAWSASACRSQDQNPSPPQAAERFVAVAAPKQAEDPVQALCDIHTEGEDAPRLSLPALEGDLPAQNDGWRWVNIWATWCKPCVEEIPMLTDWQRRLQAAGTTVELTFLSVDASAEDITDYRKSHPDTPTSLRLADARQLAELIEGLGLDEGATIPIQVFADAENRLRCVRTGALHKKDFPALQALLARN